MAIPRFQHYDPDRVLFSFGTILVSGYASGTFIKASRSEDQFSKDVGAQGDVTRVRNRDKSGEVTVTLQAGAPCNDLLSAAALFDDTTGLGFAPLFLKDLNGTTICEANIAWIKKPADVERSSEASNTEWTFECAQLFMHVGGFVVGV
jgi:hypothetical protein